MPLFFLFHHPLAFTGVLNQNFLSPLFMKLIPASYPPPPLICPISNSSFFAPGFPPALPPLLFLFYRSTTELPMLSPPSFFHQRSLIFTMVIPSSCVTSFYEIYRNPYLEASFVLSATLFPSLSLDVRFLKFFPPASFPFPSFRLSSKIPVETSCLS